jgi:uncharacterized membrane protein YhiD involved in acid resistance
MSSRKEGAAIVGAGVAACAVCCAGSIGGILAAIGLGTAVGVALYGAAALVAGTMLVLVLLLRRRRRRTNGCEPAAEPVVLTTGRRPAPAEPWSSSNDL